MVCADGGNPDPTITHGKRVAEAKRIEGKGWDYVEHLAGRADGLVVHGDVAGVEDYRRHPSDWLEWMGLIDAGAIAKPNRYIGCYGPSWRRHDTLDKDKAVQGKVRKVASAVVPASKALGAGQLSRPDSQIKAPREN